MRLGNGVLDFHVSTGGIETFLILITAAVITHLAYKLQHQLVTNQSRTINGPISHYYSWTIIPLPSVKHVPLISIDVGKTTVSQPFGNGFNPTYIFILMTGGWFMNLFYHTLIIIIEQYISHSYPIKKKKHDTGTFLP